MRYFAGISILLLFGTIIFAAEPDPVKQEMLKQLIQLNKNFSEMDKKIKNVTEKQNNNFGYQNQQNNNVLNEQLTKIKYPSNPTRENQKKYIDDILKIAAKYTSYSSNGLQTKMLKKVGSENISLLIERLEKETSGPGRCFLTYAITALARPSDKQAVIRLLKSYHVLISVVLKYGWEHDAKDIIINYITYNSNIGNGWYVAAINLQDPKLNDALVKYFIRSCNRRFLFQYIKNLPGIDIREVVNQAWKAARYSTNNLWQLNEIAMIAVPYGNVEAFEHLLALAGKPEFMYNFTEGKFLIDKYSAKHGSLPEIRSWVKNNRKNIIFDEKTRLFTVKKNHSKQER